MRKVLSCTRAGLVVLGPEGLGAAVLLLVAAPDLLGVVAGAGAAPAVGIATQLPAIRHTQLSTESSREELCEVIYFSHDGRQRPGCAKSGER
jgi:hypothetical protein